ncbi:MAG: sulfatase-like hydrolase/transferase [Myxococcota bacterium]
MTPNVLIVLLDDVGADKVAAYGFPDAPPTPTLSALADEGVRFDQAWATPVCSPTRAALMTGRFAYRNSVGAVIMNRQVKELPLDELTLAEVARSAATPYATAAVGKWHLATADSPSGLGHAHAQGFQQFAGSMNNIAGDHTYVSWDRVGFDGVEAVETGFSTTVITDDAITAARHMQEPFLLYVAFHAAHRPLMPPPEAVLGGFEVDPQSETSLYDANLVAADHEIGRLLDALGERRERTVVFVIGDNGTPGHAKDAEGMEGGKGSFTEGGLRVPFLVSGPGVTARGASDALISVVDVLPTVAELAGVERLDPTLDGVSLVPAFTDLGARVHERLYSETRHPAEGPPWRNVGRAARDASLKVVEEDGDRTVFAIDGFTEAPVDRSDLAGAERRRVRKLESEIDCHDP